MTYLVPPRKPGPRPGACGGLRVSFVGGAWTPAFAGERTVRT
jgi:hypothetical protein